MVKAGEFIFELFDNAGINFTNVDRMKRLIDECSMFLANSPEYRRASRMCLSIFLDALKSTFKPANADPTMMSKFKCHIQRKDIVSHESSYGINFPIAAADRILSLWCFSSGVAMQEIVAEGVRSIILASGTLAPLESFADELGVHFRHRLENTHVIHSSQIFVGIVSKGPYEQTLSSAYGRKDDRPYLQDLGNSIVNFCRIVPDGVLVFFTSYSAMTKGIEEWKRVSYNSNRQKAWEQPSGNASSARRNAL